MAVLSPWFLASTAPYGALSAVFGRSQLFFWDTAIFGFLDTSYDSVKRETQTDQNLHILAAFQLFRDHARKARRLSEPSVQAYGGDVRDFVAWRTKNTLPLTVKDVEPAEIEDFIADCSHLSPASIRRRLDAISSLFRFLMKRDLAQANPIDSVDRPRCPDSHRPHLTEQQMTKLADVVQDPQDRTILALLCQLGIRRSEITRLDIGDVDLANNRLQIRQSKGGRSRTLPIPSDLEPVLRDHLAERNSAPESPAFVSCRGNRLSRSVLGRLFSKWLKLAGLDGLGLSPHSCRHGAATRWLNSGLSIVEVQHLLGHASVDVTGRYCHTSLSQIAAAIESKVPALGTSPSPISADDMPREWHDALVQLDGDQRAALLMIARSMASSKAQPP